MTEHQTSRTIVKSAPELWAECSDAGSLARHLGAFGEIRITRLEPESTVAWEGDAARGTVRLEPAGWGTRVTMTLTEEVGARAEVAASTVPTDPPKAAGPSDSEAAVVPAAPPEPPEAAAPEPPEAAAPPEPPEAASSRPGFFARLMARWRGSASPAADVPAPEPAAEATAPELTAEATAPGPAAEVPPPDPDPMPEPEPPAPEPVPEPAPVPPAEQLLAAALDSLGRAHHRPFSRA